MKLRPAIGRGALFATVLILALGALIPLSVALSALRIADAGLTARAAHGSVWRGSLSEATFGPIPLGDVVARLRFWPLVIGRARIELNGAAGRGALTFGRHAGGIDDVTAQVSAGGSLGPLPLAGFDLDGVSVRFRDGLCERAEGRVRARFSGDPGGVSLGQGLAGNIRCEGGTLLLPLVSQSTLAGLAIRIAGDGGWRAELMMRNPDPALAAPLAGMGFTPATGGYVLRARGTLAP